MTHPSSTHESNTPRATYRVQLSPTFGFEQAAAILPYLSALGVSHVYFSPYFAAPPESTHGYDIVDPLRVRAELGGEQGLARLVEALKAHGLSQMIDIVPNHMGVETEHNLYFWDVLQKGPRSEHACLFDIEWNAHGDGKIVLPILPMPEREALTSGHVFLRERDGELVLMAGNRALPLRAESVHGESHEDVLRRCRNPEALASLLAQQHYRLAYFRTGLAEINYRRFLDISSLAATPVEDPAVFAKMHGLIVKWVSEGSVAAIRVDHPDGLTDPEGYFVSLRRAAPGAWIVAEKILSPGESLPKSWLLDGTTGYEFLNLATGLFIDREGLAKLESTYASFVRRSLPPFETVLWECKHHALAHLLTAEVARLERLMLRAAPARGVQLDPSRLRQALVELVARMSVGRTYARPGGALSEQERAMLQAARRDAVEHRPELEGHVDAIVELVSSAPIGEIGLRFQQLSAAAHAKGLEDTAFYRYGLLLALNEVGAEPTRPGYSLADLHRVLRAGRDAQPKSLLCTTTHDTKRGEDTRLRIAALSEIPERWNGAVHEWSEILRKGRSQLLDREMEYFVFQTLVGVWPISEDRLLNYLRKAAREAKRHTSWLEPYVDYETALRLYVSAALSNAEFVRSFEAFLSPIVEAARTHALTQTLTKLTAPGIPDIYQGAELWDLSLVDPDNRRPVDFAERQRLLSELTSGMTPDAILARADQGLPKLWVLKRALDVRRQRPESLAPTAPYEPLLARHDPHGTIVSYLRSDDVLVVAPRFVLRRERELNMPVLPLPSGTWIDALTGQRFVGGDVPTSTLLARFPVALLTRE